MFKPISILIKVLPDKVDEKTEGGIYLPQAAQDQQGKAGVTGTIVSIGCDVDTSIFTEGAKVLHVRYAGVVHKDADGVEYRYLKDEDIIAVEGVAHA